MHFQRIYEHQTSFNFIAPLLSKITQRRTRNHKQMCFHGSKIYSSSDLHQLITECFDSLQKQNQRQILLYLKWARNLHMVSCEFMWRKGDCQAMVTCWKTINISESILQHPLHCEESSQKSQKRNEEGSRSPDKGCLWYGMRLSEQQMKMNKFRFKVF